jgi:tripartite-type tricarboxylate transporter receptor subunit TctC
MKSITGFVATLGIAASSAIGSAYAHSWPTRPITMVIPFAAGGANDAFGRIIGPRLSEILGTPVIIENVVGAGGMTGSARIAKAAPDGYQILLGSSGTHAINQTLYKSPFYTAATDFTPVALIAETPLVVVTRRNFPADNLQDFIGYAKANHAKIQYGSAGAGSAGHLACALLNVTIGINVSHVPYRGGGQVMQDLIAGRIDYQCTNAVVAISHIETGQIKALAMLSATRSSILPTLPSAQEQGLRNFAADNWIAFFLPKHTPAEIVQKLHGAAVATMETPSVRQRLKEVGADVVSPERRSSEYLRKFVEAQVEKWAVLIRDAGLISQ